MSVSDAMLNGTELYAWRYDQYLVALQYHLDVGLPGFNEKDFNSADGDEALRWLKSAWNSAFKDPPLTGAMQLYDPEIGHGASGTVLGWWFNAVLARGGNDIMDTSKYRNPFPKYTLGDYDGYTKM